MVFKVVFGDNFEIEIFDNLEEGDRSMKYLFLILDFFEVVYVCFEYYFKVCFGMG